MLKTSTKTYITAGIIAESSSIVSQVLEEKWPSVLNSQLPKFRQGREARIVVGKSNKRRINSTGRAVKKAYRNLPVRIDNCSGMISIEETEQDEAAKRGNVITVWNQFR